MRRRFIGEDEKKAEIKPNKGSRAFGYRGYSSSLLYEGISKELEQIENSLKPAPKENMDQSSNKAKKTEKDYIEKYTKDPTSFLKTNRTGKYKEVPSTHKDIIRAYELMDKAKAVGDVDGYLKILELVIPISDERGYELIGTYEYGRTLYLNRNNVIKKKGASFAAISTKADVGKFNETDTLQISSRGSDVVKELDTPNQNDKLEIKKAVENFIKDKSSKLARLDPRKDSDIKRCTCTTVNMQAAPVKPKFPKKTIQDVGRRN